MARSTNEPHTPLGLPVTTRKHTPLQGEGVMPVGMRQGWLSSSSAGFGAANWHAPVRELQRSGATQCASSLRNGKHPGESGVPPKCDSHQPVHTWPGRQLAFIVGRQDFTHNAVASVPSPMVRQVAPAPPHGTASLAWLTFCVHVVDVQRPPATLVSHESAPHIESSVHALPAGDGPLAVFVRAS